MYVISVMVKIWFNRCKYMCVDKTILKIYIYNAVITISAARHDIYKYNNKCDV